MSGQCRRSGDVVALCIGINRYRASKDGTVPDLSCAMEDATAFRGCLVDVMKVSPDRVHLLTDEKATREGIRRSLAWLAREGRGRAAYVYYSIHGVPTADPEDRPDVVFDACYSGLTAPRHRCRSPARSRLVRRAGGGRRRG